MNIRKLSEAPVNADAIQLLEEAMKMVQANPNMKERMICFRDQKEGRIYSNFTKVSDVALWIGMLEIQKQRLMPQFFGEE